MRYEYLELDIDEDLMPFFQREIESLGIKSIGDFCGLCLKSTALSKDLSSLMEEYKLELERIEEAYAKCAKKPDLTLIEKYPLASALNPNLDEASLFKLSFHSNPLVRSAVALNPNTPNAVLLRLLPLFTDSVVKNPSACLATLRLALKSSLVMDIIDHPNADKKLVAELFEQLSPEQCTFLAQTGKNPYLLIKLSDTLSRMVSLNPNCNKDVLDYLADFENLEVRLNVLQHPNVTEDAQCKIYSC